jgi:PTS system cellobiose-specific IIC component
LGEQGLSLNLDYLGYSGVFVAFVLGIIVVEFNRFSIYLRSKFKPKTETQERLAQPIEATLFTLLIITVALASRYALQLNSILLPDLLFNAMTPWLTSSNTLWFVLSVIVLSKLLWFIGFNGNSLILISLMPMMVVFNAENLFAYQNDKALPYLFTTGFLFFELGVLPLATAILLFSKNKAHRSSAKLGLLPSIFNFQETMIAGLPLTFNGFFLIPFILSSVISLGGTYLAMTFYWVNKPLFAFSPALPGFLGAFLSTVDWKAPVLWFALYILCTLIYWPFIRVQNKKETQSVKPVEEAALKTVVE